MFYVAINSGSFASSFAVPLIRNAYGYRIAFLFPAALMIVAFSLFVVGKPFYAKETIRRGRATSAAAHANDGKCCGGSSGFFAVAVFFWSVIEQYDSTWILFARDHVDLNVFDYAPGTWQAGLLTVLRQRLHVKAFGEPLMADQFQVLNPILVMVLVPLVAVVWRLLARAGLNLRPTDKMSIGFAITLATPLILAIAGAERVRPAASRHGGSSRLIS